ncbi:MAG TPA: hypothetical protein VEJ36_03590 [Nitrososphaerales archaeon]|nr:hypothetical protein [Nitrososphaerales archaeon]
MPSSKVETTVIGVAVLSGLVACVLAAAGFSDPPIGFSPQNDYVGPFVVAIFVLWFYAAYWAFDIRRALSAPLFRNQALGMGLVAIGWLGFNAFNSFPQSEVGIVVFEETGAVLVAIVLTLYWIDASILAAQHTDPLQRNTLRWREVRWILWPFFAFVTALTLLVSFVPSLVGLQPVWNGAAGIGAIGIIVAVLAAAFARSVMRSKDRTIKMHLRWFGLSLAGWLGILTIFPIVATSLGISSLNATTASQALAYTAFAYCVYRSAKSLAPLEQVQRLTT